MKTLAIEFTRPKKGCFAILSQVIRAVQGTKYSHVRLRWTNTTGRDVIYEASGSHVKFIGELAQPQAPVEIMEAFELNLTIDQYRSLVDMCMRYAGLKYGKLQIVGIGLVTLFRLKKNPFADGKRSQVCSELVGRFLQEVVKIDIKFDLDIAGPKEINLVLDEECLRPENGIKRIL